MKAISGAFAMRDGGTAEATASIVSILPRSPCDELSTEWATNPGVRSSGCCLGRGSIEWILVEHRGCREEVGLGTFGDALARDSA